MAGIAFVYMTIEVILLAAISFGSYFGRKLDMKWHHRLIYTTLGAQLVVFLIWMGPGVGYYRSEGGITTILGLHIVVGLLSFICCIVLAIVFLKDRNQYDIPKLRWTRPLMIFTLILWIISFSLGTTFFMLTYL